MTRTTVILTISLLYLLFFISPAHALSWGSNPREIGPGESVTISINGDCPPYTWSVKGNGFTILKSKTVEPINTLSATDNACGATDLMVADSCENIITGYVYSDEGSWYQTCLTGHAYNKGCYGYYLPDKYLGRYRIDSHCSKCGSHSITSASCTFTDGFYYEESEVAACQAQGLVYCGFRGYEFLCTGQIDLPPGAENDDCKSKISE